MPFTVHVIFVQLRSW